MSRARRPRPARTRALGVVGTSSGAPSRCSWSRPTIHQREPTGVDQLAAGCSSCRAARFSPIAEQSASEGVLENEGFSSWLLNSMADIPLESRWLTRSDNARTTSLRRRGLRRAGWSAASTGRSGRWSLSWPCMTGRCRTARLFGRATSGPYRCIELWPARPRVAAFTRMGTRWSTL